MTNLFLRFWHGGPTPGALIRDILGLRIRAKIRSNLRTIVMHVQEVWGQRTLWRIRIMRRALALLLFGLTTGGAASSRERTPQKTTFQ